MNLDQALEAFDKLASEIEIQKPLLIMNTEANMIFIHNLYSRCGKILETCEHHYLNDRKYKELLGLKTSVKDKTDNQYVLACLSGFVDELINWVSNQISERNELTGNVRERKDELNTRIGKWTTLFNKVEHYRNEYMNLDNSIVQPLYDDALNNIQKTTENREELLSRFNDVLVERGAVQDNYSRQAYFLAEFAQTIIRETEKELDKLNTRPKQPHRPKYPGVPIEAIDKQMRPRNESIADYDKSAQDFIIQQHKYQTAKTALENQQVIPQDKRHSEVKLVGKEDNRKWYQLNRVSVIEGIVIGLGTTGIAAVASNWQAVVQTIASLWPF